MSEESITLSKIAEPVHVTLTRNSKGKYQWEISIHTPSADEALDIAVGIDRRLEREYKGRAAGEEAEVKKE